MASRASSSGTSTHEEHSTHERVLLHIYELGSGTRLAEAIKGLNAVTKTGLGAGGVFHAAIEVENLGKALEWSYGYCTEGSGVFAAKAKQHPDHQYRETIVLGRTAISRDALLRLIRRMQLEWWGDAYHLVRCNCISFCRAVASELGVGPVPDWVDRFPRIGAGAVDFAEKTSSVFVAAKDALATALPLGAIAHLAEVDLFQGRGDAQGDGGGDDGAAGRPSAATAAVTTTPASDAAAEILNLATACMQGMAAYTGMQVGRFFSDSQQGAPSAPAPSGAPGLAPSAAPPRAGKAVAAAASAAQAAAPSGTFLAGVGNVSQI